MLGHFPTPVVSSPLSPNLWIKRDDVCADPLGGNKVRALEFLLGGVEKDDDVVTVGSAGSTHALAVATYGKRLGARVSVGRWKQEMNDSARRVAERVGATAKRAPIFRTPVEAFAWAWLDRARGSRWIPAGGSSALGILGHVNAGLELVRQIDARLLPSPNAVVVPLGTGGTAAGLALAFAIAQRAITVVGVRVVPRIVARLPRVHRLANDTAKLIERSAGVRLPRVGKGAVTIVHDSYGGGYGRETAEAKTATDQFRAVSSLELDSTYSAKAFATALDLAERGPTLFWLTFDSRTLSSS